MIPMSAFRLGDLGKIVTGKTPAAANPEHFGLEIPFLTPTDIDGVARHVTTGRFLSTAGARAFQRLLLPPQSVCCVCIGATIGKVCLTRDITASNQQINSIIVDQAHHDPRFIFYKLLTLGDALKARAGGAATPIVNKSQFSDLEVELPNLAIQSLIADVLSAYDDLIGNNTRRIAILEEMARRIFEEWFIHFRPPSCEGLPMVHSAIGPVPQRWDFIEVKNIITKKRPGLIYRREDCRSIGQVIVLDQSTDEFLGFHDKEPDHDASPQEPLIIFGDHTCKMQMMVSPFSIGQNTIVFGARPDLSVHYVYALVRGLTVTREYKRHWNDLQKKVVLVAPAALTTDYGHRVRPLFTLSDNIRRQIRNLRAQRDLLLPKLISGEIEVNAALASIKEAAE